MLNNAVNQKSKKGRIKRPFCFNGEVAYDQSKTKNFNQCMPRAL